MQPLAVKKLILSMPCCVQKSVPSLRSHWQMQELLGAESAAAGTSLSPWLSACDKKVPGSEIYPDFQPLGNCLFKWEIDKHIYIYNTYIFETKCCTHIFRPMISVKSGSSHLEDHLPSTNLGKAPYKIPAGPGTLVRLALWAPANRHRGFKKLNMELV